MSPIWIAWLVLSSLPDIHVEDPVACVDPAALRDAVALELPNKPGVEKLSLHVQLFSLPARSDEAAPLGLSIILRDAQRRAVLERHLDVVRGDCPHLPRLVATIVGRHLHELPSQTWRLLTLTPADPGPAQPLESERALAEEAQEVEGPPVTPRSPWELRLGVTWGGGLGISGLSPFEPLEPAISLATGDIQVTGWGSTELGLGLRTIVLVRATGTHIALGEGGVQIWTARVGVGLGYDVDLAGVTLVPQLLLAGGGYVGSGVGFDQSLTALLPLSAVHGRLVVLTERMVLFCLEVEVPITRAELYVRGENASYLEPGIRLAVAIGVEIDLVL